MTIEIKVPVLPESVSDATIATWHKKVGDSVERDENILDLETDKVVLEIPSPEAGVIKSIAFNEGDVVTTDQVLAEISTDALSSDKSSSEDQSTKQTEHSSVAEKQQPTENNGSVSKTSPVSEALDQQISPAVRRMAKEYDIDLAQISGTGRDGRISTKDVEQFLQSKKTNNEAASTVMSAGARQEERVPMSRLRARIAERLVESQQTAAILTTFNEVNMHAVMQIRKQYKDLFEKKHQVRLGFMSFFTKAVVEALKQFPSVNASLDGTDVIYHGYCDVGIAVSSPRGLVVPILRNVEQMSLADIEREIARYGQKAKEGKLTVEEMTGGTFTISNGGVFGSLLSTPIINPPQSAILGMHKIEERPVVEQGQIVIRPMMYLALSYDHRLIDGRESVSFLVTIKELLEDPARLILAV